MEVRKADLISFAFDNKDKFFIIPVYQRNYNWSVELCNTLLDDIIEVYSLPRKHFLGTITLAVQDLDEQAITNYIIVDGQQRLTSIYLLLKALYDIGNESQKKDIERYLNNDTQDKQVHGDARFKLKLKAVKGDQDQLIALMNGGKTDPNSQIIINYSHFKDEIQKRIVKSEVSFENIVNGLKKLEVAVITLKETQDDPFVVFERMNSTYLALSLSDKVRNYLLMTEPNMDYLYNTYWLDAEKNVGKTNMDQYIYSYLVFILHDISEDKAYSAFKEYMKDNNLSRETVLKDIQKYSKYYAVFIGMSDAEYPNNILKSVRVFNNLNQTTIFPLLFSVFADYDDKIIYDDTLLNLLDFLTTYVVRRTIVGTPTNSLRGFFSTLYRRVFATIEPNNSNYLKSFYDSFIDFTNKKTKNAIHYDDEVINSLKTNPIYSNSNSRFCKFLLASLENKSSNKNEEVVINNTITIEHIMPQTPNLWWQNETNKNPEIRTTHLHILGNLSLTGVNSVMQNEPFPDKKQTYKNSAFTYLYEDVIDKEHWRGNEIEKRGERLAQRTIEVFPLPRYILDRPANNEFETINDNLSLFTCHLDEITKDFDFKTYTPVSFEFGGVPYDVKSLRDVIMRICKIMYNNEPDSFISMVQSKGTQESSDYYSTFISFDPSNYHTPTEIYESGIYLEFNRGGNDIFSYIGRILDYFQIDHDEMLVTFEKKKSKKDKSKGAK